mgnify:CR=1 FL=1
MDNYFRKIADRYAGKHIYNDSDPAQRDHIVARNCLSAAVFYFIARDSHHARIEFEMWRYLHKLRE